MAEAAPRPADTEADLSEAQSRRYAEAVRRQTIVERQLERIKPTEASATQLVEGVETVRALDRPEEPARYDARV